MKVKNTAAPLCAITLCLALLAPGLARAQEPGQDTLALLRATTPPPADLVDLAARYRGLVEVEPAHETPADVGDAASFTVMDAIANTHDRVSARLVYATPGVKMWVQEGTAVNEDRLAEAAETLDADIFPAVRALFGADAGGPVHVLHAFGLGQGLGYFNSHDTLPQAVYELSNARALLVVNLEMALSFLSAESEIDPETLSLASALYYSVLAREYTRLLNFMRQPDEDAWLDMAFAELGALRAGYPNGVAASAFLEAPGTQLTHWSDFNADAQAGAGLLFTAYVAERYGDDVLRAWAAGPSKGLDALDAALRAQGEDAAALDVFADWVVTNAVNDPAFADGRYAYRELDLTPPRARVDVIFDTFPVSVTGAAVSQFGAQYLVLAAPPDGDAAHLIFAFAGAASTPVLPLEPHSGRYVYWSNRGSAIDTTLTRAFDLSGVSDATLTFWAWYDTEPYRDYAYVSVSDDGGATWTALPATTTTFENPNRLAVGAGFTGRSGAGDVIPYPYLGVAFGEGLTINDAPTGSPASEAGLRVGDVITAVDGLRVASPADLTAVLDTHAVGDVATVTVMRAGAPLDIEVTLGAHPTRYRPAPPAWVEQTVDLSAYAGRSILLRFEYIADQGLNRSGFAVDDIRIDAIGYADDAETDAGSWEAAGWVRMDNTLPGRFLVQLVQGTRVTRLVGPDDPVTGAWPISVEPGEVALLAISGVTPFTTAPGRYTYELTPVE